VNGDGGDLDIELALRLDVVSAVEQRNLAMYANGVRRTGTEPAPTKVLEMLLEFMEAKASRAVAKEDPVRALQALIDVDVVLRDLIRFGHAEFEPMHKKFKAGFARIAQACRQRLVRDYLDLATPAEELPGIHKTLCELIRRGGWENWREEYDAAIQEEAERRASSIVPAA
jgi:hypothetical protein